jgi:hypothetical protein
MKNTSIAQLTAVVMLALVSSSPKGFSQGSLTPPGAPAPMMKTLQQIEPRTDVLTLSSGSLARYNITVPGSYYLTTNVIGVAANTAIRISCDNVTLDLNGFSVLGTSGDYGGLIVAGSKVTVCNGVIRGCSGVGLLATADARGCRYDKLVVAENSDYGISVGADSTLTDCKALGNVSCGIRAGTGAQLSGCEAITNNGTGFYADKGSQFFNCLATSNGYWGFIVKAGSTLSGCTSAGNGDQGVDADTDCTLRDCKAVYNADTGFNVTTNCQVLNCSAVGNHYQGISASEGTVIRGCVSATNYAAGIYASHGCYIVDNTCQRNLVGIQVTGDNSRIEGNHCIRNATGIQVASGYGNTIFRNSVASATSPFDISSGNDLGPLGRANTATSPWANIEF